LENSYICERTLEKPPRCTFRISRVILQRDIPKEQVQKLMTAGKTDLLPKFISKKGRAFSAYLKLENGKVGFEFEPRKPRATKPRLKKVTAAT
jgi:DNA topoisomerase-3